MSHPDQIDFDAINRTALDALPALLLRWCPGGRRVGSEYVVRNPKRSDRRPGSFSINLRTGAWGDFARGARGGDPISLVAYLFDLKQIEAAKELRAMLGLGSHRR